MWDYIRTYMKIQGVHYDRYTPKQAAELIAKANDAGEEIPDDLAMLEGVVRLQRGDFDDMLRRRYHGAGESRKTELATKKGAER